MDRSLHIAAMLDFQNIGILGFGRVKRSKCITMPNFVAIGETVGEIW